MQRPSASGSAMTLTTMIPQDRLAESFDSFTKRFLRHGSPEALDVEVLEPDWGDQEVARGVRLLGITYDRRSGALEFALESGDHRIYAPADVWVVQEADGFLSAIAIMRPDGSHEVVSVKRVGLQRIHSPVR